MNNFNLDKLYPEEFATCHLCHEKCTAKYRKPGNFVDLPQADAITDYYLGITRNSNEYLPRGKKLVKDFCENCVKQYYLSWINGEI